MSAWTSISDMTPGLSEHDLLLLTVKAGQVEQAAEDLAPCAPMGTPPILAAFQNGTGFEDGLRVSAQHRFGVVLCVSHLGATLSQSGVVEDWGGRLMFPDSDTGQRLCELFGSCGMAVETVQDLESERWKKVAFNCALNPFCAILNVRNRETITEALRPWRERVLREVHREAVETGVKLPEPEELLKELEALASASNNVNSMLQDVRRHRPTEIEYLNGAIVRMAQEGGREANCSRRLSEWIRRLERATSAETAESIRTRILEEMEEKQVERRL